MTIEPRAQLDFSRTPWATDTLRTTTPISAVFSGKRLDFRSTRPSKILATNSETVGFQDHSLRQHARVQHSLGPCGRAEKPNNGGPSWTDLRTLTHRRGLGILSDWPIRLQTSALRRFSTDFVSC